MEVFYWPAGAVAYLPTLAATLLLFLQGAEGRLSTKAGQRLGCMCLLVAGSSSETGATFVVCFALLQTLWFVVDRAPKPPSASESLPHLWWLFPGALSALLLVVVRFNRYHVVERPAATASTLAGQWSSSLLAGAKTLLLEAAGGPTHNWHGIGVRLLSEICLALGITLCWSRRKRLAACSRRQLGTLSGALLLASLFTAAASYLHFGGLCCERHEVLRRAWIAMSLCGLGIVTLSPLFASRWRKKGGASLVGALLICLSVALVWHTGTLVKQYRLYSAISYATSQNFSSGLAPAPDMVFLLPPDTALILGEQVAPGRYTLGSPAGRLPHYLLEYFHKESVLVRAPDDWMRELEQSNASARH